MKDSLLRELFTEQTDSGLFGQSIVGNSQQSIDKQSKQSAGVNQKSKKNQNRNNKIRDSIINTLWYYNNADAT